MAQSEIKKQSVIMMRTRAAFLRAQRGVRLTGGSLRLEAILSASTRCEPHVGITVSKKNGNSVMRSRIKRRIRHALYLTEAGDMRPGHDYVFIAKPNAISVPFETLRADIEGLIDKSNKRFDSLRDK